MKVLLVNKFHYHKGGDTAVFFSTMDLLKARGHRVSAFAMRSPQDLDSEYSRYFASHVSLEAASGVFGKLKAAGRVLYSFEAKKKISTLAEKERPDIAHLHNICHQLSPSIISALRSKCIPVVMTLHDYKLTCPAYTLLKDGVLCEACSGGRYSNALRKRCTKGSLLKSLVNMAEMYLHHKVLGLYEQADIFISPSRFLLEKTREMGFKGDLRLLPNFLVHSVFAPCYSSANDSIVYFGRLSAEKGVGTLIEAVKGLPLSLKVVGDGPLGEALKDKVRAGGNDNVQFLGFKTGDDLKTEISSAMFTVIPSEWYENNPRTVIEAFALGKPVVGARIGGIPELVRDNETGLLFEPGNADDLREKILMLASDRALIERLGRNARALVEAELNHEVHYRGLISIYEDAIKKSKMKRA